MGGEDESDVNLWGMDTIEVSPDGKTVLSGAGKLIPLIEPFSCGIWRAANC